MKLAYRFTWSGREKKNAGALCFDISAWNARTIFQSFLIERSFFTSSVDLLHSFFDEVCRKQSRRLGVLAGLCRVMDPFDYAGEVRGLGSHAANKGAAADRVGV